jgi:antitoxin CptB
VITDPPEVRHARIAWRCRRGMRELDLLLEKFLLSGLTTLSDDDLDRLEHLLVQADQDILAWLTSAVTAEDAEIRRIVTVLRSRIYAPSNAPER